MNSREPDDDGYDGIDPEGIARIMPPAGTRRRALSALTAKRELVAREAERYREKAARAERRLQILDMIPDRDPYADGQVLSFSRRGYTYAAIRAAGNWYPTGSAGPQGMGWAAFVEWLLNGDVEAISELSVSQQLWLGVAPDSPEPPASHPFGGRR